MLIQGRELVIFVGDWSQQFYEKVAIAACSKRKAIRNRQAYDIVKYYTFHPFIRKRVLLV
jgi:hypothetical protein